MPVNTAVVLKLHVRISDSDTTVPTEPATPA